MECDLLDKDDQLKEWYLWTCKKLGLKREKTDLLALRRFARPQLRVEKGDRDEQPFGSVVRDYAV